MESKRGSIIIRQGKGKKDRIVPLSPRILEMLLAYYIACRPRTFLFEGMQPGEPYTARSLQLVLKKALKKVGISKPVTLHWLMHSYAGLFSLRGLIRRKTELARHYPALQNHFSDAVIDPLKALILLCDHAIGTFQLHDPGLCNPFIGGRDRSSIYSGNIGS